MLSLTIAFVVFATAVVCFWLGFREGRASVFRVELKPKPNGAVVASRASEKFADDAAALADIAIDLDRDSLEWQIKRLSVRAYDEGMADLRAAFATTSALPDGMAEQIATEAIVALTKDRAV